jgi:flagellin
MAAILSTNMASLYAQKNLSTAQASLSDSVQRLSSGTRINSAKDDAAGYGISESIRGAKNVVDQNIRNAKDGISWAQTAEGALDVVGKMLQRSLTLATQATNPTLNDDQRDSIALELEALVDEIERIEERTKFQGGATATAVFDSSGNANIIDVETGGANPTQIEAKMVDTADITAAVTAIQANTLAITDLEAIEDLIAVNATNRGILGVAINSLEYAVDNMQTMSTNLADGISRIVDTDYAAETSNLTRTQILQQAATSMLAQANQMPNVILTLLK